MESNNISSVMITSPAIQKQAFKSGDLKIQLQIARTTESREVQEEIAESDNPRLLVALAGNVNLHPSVEKMLVETELPGVISALLNRRG